MEGSTDGYRGWDETVLLLFASLLLPRVTKGLNRVVSSLTRWLPDSALNIDETQLAFPFTLAPGLAGEVCQGEQLSSLAGCSVSAVLSVLGASAETANEGTA